MKATSLWQPWASLCFELNPATGAPYKTVETRGRRTPWHTVIGQTIALASTQRKAIRDDPGMHPDLWRPLMGCYVPFGELIGTVHVDDVVPILAATDELANEPQRPCIVPVGDTLTLYRDDSTAGEDIDEQRPYGDYTPGRWAVLFSNAVKLGGPVAASGARQGLWECNVPTPGIVR